MTNTDKTDRNKEEIELWESITKNDKKYKKHNYFLDDNEINVEGAKALAGALYKNEDLQYLELSK